MRPAGSCVLLGGRIRTLDDDGTVATGIAIDRGVIAAVGDDAGRALPPDAPRIDLEGRTVLPGMIDAHAHIELSTMAERLWVDVRFCEPAETVARIRRAAEGAEPGAWIVAQGTFGARLPSRTELDDAGAGRPVLVRESMHLLAASSAALERAGIDRHSATPLESRVERTAEGEPTGVVREGFDLFPSPRPSVDWLARELRAVTRSLFVEHGVTTVCELPASTNGMRAWQRLLREDALPCRLTLNPILAPGHQPIVRSLEDYLGLGLTTGFGGPWLRIGALKLFVDGGDFVSGFYRRSVDRRPDDWGIVNFTYPQLVGILTRCRSASVQVWMHAIGDAAQEMALAAVEEVNRAAGNGDHRTRIEHIGNHVFDPDLLPRMREAGVIPVPNAVFIFSEEPDLAESAPGAGFYPFRTMHEHGLITPGNSDCAGTQPFAANPWYGIHAMLTRRTKGGAVLDPAETVDLSAAIATYTRHAAYAAFEEHTRGSLEPGKLGDLAVYPDDPYGLAVDDLAGVAPDVVMIGGEIVVGADMVGSRPASDI
jgi:predicted amidohydrolase YtcJ